MGFEARLWLSFLLILAIVSSSGSARINVVSLSGKEMVLMGGRSLKVNLDDYGEPSANRGHDPPRSRGVGGGRKG
ncbi:hypothetical protein ACOSP7_025140 [Xanthoceras sorbifolium]